MPDLPVLSETASSFCLWDAEIPADKNKVPVESASFPADFHSSFHTLKSIGIRTIKDVPFPG